MFCTQATARTMRASAVLNNCLHFTSSAAADEDRREVFSHCYSSGQRKQARSYQGLMFTMDRRSLQDGSRPFPNARLRLHLAACWAAFFPVFISRHTLGHAAFRIPKAASCCTPVPYRIGISKKVNAANDLTAEDTPATASRRNSSGGIPDLFVVLTSQTRTKERINVARGGTTKTRMNPQEARRQRLISAER